MMSEAAFPSSLQSLSLSDLFFQKAPLYLVFASHPFYVVEPIFMGRFVYKQWHTGKTNILATVSLF